MSEQQLMERFEVGILQGRDRNSVMMNAIVGLGADGQYFNAQTRSQFEAFKRGVASVEVQIPTFDEWPDSMARDMRDALRKAVLRAGGSVR